MSNGEHGFEPLLGTEDLGQGEIRTFVVRGWPVVVTRAASGVCALLNRCSHAGSSFDQGRVRRNTVICPLHGAQFDLATGACLSAERYPAIRTFPVIERAGWIIVQIPKDQPTHEDLPVPAY